MKRAVLATVLLAAPAAAFAQQPLNVGSLAVSQPRTVAEFDTDDVKGQPGRLAWSEDGKQLYLQTFQGERGRPTATLRHYVFSIETGKRESIDAEPDWAKLSWSKKADRSSPDAPAFMIDIATSTRLERTTSAPMGGDMARGGTGGGGDTNSGGGTSAGDAIANAAAAQTVTVHAMKLGNETIGEFVNSVIVPGLTFGWGPKGTKAIAYAVPSSGRIVIMDVTGKKQELPATKDSLLPAFSPDGTSLAWIRRDGRKSFQLQIVQIN